MSENDAKKDTDMTGEKNVETSTVETSSVDELNEAWRDKIKKFRWSISIKIYLGLATLVLLMMLASLLAWNSITEMNDIQKTITQERIPELSLAIEMGQESVSLMNTAPKLLTAENQEDLETINTLILDSTQNLSRVLEELKVNNPEDTNGTFNKLETLSLDMTGNLDLLKKSVKSTITTKANLSALLTQALGIVRSVNRDLLLDIDNQTFFLYTGWRTLRQKTPSPLSQRARQDTLNYYRSLVSLKGQVQLASNLLNEAVQETDPDLLQPLSERFEAALGNCKQALALVQNLALKNKTLERMQSLERIGLGELASGEANSGLFRLQEKVLREKRLQNGYLSSNQSIAQNLAAQTEQMIKDIQAAGTRTTNIFEKTVSQKTGQLGILNLISIILAISIGFFLVGRHIIGRLKRLSQTMLIMSKGNLEIPLQLRGNDEITDMGRAMEVFRKYAIEAQELNLVQKLHQEVQEKNNELEGVIDKLKAAQQRIVMQEKLASLGQLTSGIAHEIKNPLNFINNFSSISKELLEDLSRELVEPENTLSEDSRSFIEDTLKDLHGNMEKINTHGQRANDIIKGMLQHSREQVEDAKEVINFNRFLESCVNLAYQGKRSGGSNFNVDFKKEYDDSIGELEINPQDISRVILNLITNACDAVEEKCSGMDPKEREGFSPCIWIATHKKGEQVEVRVGDNGFGISEEKAKKVFDPFFTTKPTDKGTGLGLSLSHDIVLKHGGSISIERSTAGGAEFVIQLPLAGAPAPKQADEEESEDAPPPPPSSEAQEEGKGSSGHQIQ